MEQKTLDARCVDVNVKAIRTWDLTDVQVQMLREGHEEGFVQKAIAEYRRFMELSLLMPHEEFPISRPVDLVWHTHILFTRDYCAFGQVTVGRYIHHIPCISENERVALRPKYEKFLLTYRNAFNSVPDESYWPSASQVCSNDPDCRPLRGGSRVQY